MSTSKAEMQRTASQVMTTKEVAQMLGLTEGRIRHFLSENKFGRKIGGRYLIFRDEVLEFAKHERVKGRPPKK